MTDGFLHLTDAEDDTPVRIRIGSIDAMYVNIDRHEVRSFHGQSVATREREPFTMIVFANGCQHGVRESVEEVEAQMADFFELAGMELAACE